MSGVQSEVVFYNDLTTNHYRRPTGCEITRVPPPTATGKNTDRAFVYDAYTNSMWMVSRTGQLLYNGKELTVKEYKEYCAAARV
jgi:hypothetical protein